MLSLAYYPQHNYVDPWNTVSHGGHLSYKTMRTGAVGNWEDHSEQ